MTDSVVVKNEMPRPTKDALIQVEWACVRVRRNQLLSETDYTQGADSPLDEASRAQVAAYRKALRDVPQDVGDPFAVVWPEKPELLK